MISSNEIRNFCIIAHIDHGKSTLADRMMQATGTVSDRDIKEQTLDSMDIERDRGITIKSTPVKMQYSFEGKEYTLNLIDTPGHVDFSYEVSRALAACETAILIVDASQGIQAQTLANVLMAMERDMLIIPVINKIDLPAADVERVKTQIEEILAIPSEDCISCSAKTGEGVSDILEQIIKGGVAPYIEDVNYTKALIFDSVYNSYRGAIPYVKIVSGSIKRGDKIKFMSTGEVFEVSEVGVFIPKMQSVDRLDAGMVGYVCATIRKARQVHIGDTIVNRDARDPTLLVGFSMIQPVVFAGIYPIDSSEFPALEDALAKLQLNDSALNIAKENSTALGFGFRCGFLGLLHLEITVERIKREFDIHVLTCTPSVSYLCTLKDGSEVEVNSPALMPDRMYLQSISEPWVVSKIMTPNEYIGDIISLALSKRGLCISTDSMDDKRVMLTYHFPLSEIITDFSDRLKSATKGFASFDYSMLEYRVGNVVKMSIMLNGDTVDAFTSIVHNSASSKKGRWLCEKLSELIPKSLVKVAIQATANGKIIARSTITALKKDVTAKCYGGDISRKMKLWNKQKEGKKKMRQFGKVNVPHETFIKVIKESTI
ncbi:MAG: translation elongation factor 4 [Chlamydiia bacterium]|nr:translation elongation factor 4 [Chlamydiia bacterium]